MAVPENEKRTPIFDWQRGEFVTDLAGNVATATEEQAVEQILIKAQQTARGLYLIYADVENPENDHKYGSEVMEVLTQRELSEEVRLSELERAITEAIIYDPWVTEVYDVVATRKGTDEVQASLTVRTIFDNEVQLQGVTIINE